MRDFCGCGVCSFYNVISSTLMPMEDNLEMTPLIW